jgi:hypothetical protein
MSFHRAQISFKWGENNVREKKETRYPKICEWEKIRPASSNPRLPPTPSKERINIWDIMLLSFSVMGLLLMEIEGWEVGR